MCASGIGCEAVIRYLFEVKSFSLIRNDDRNSLAGSAAGADVNFFFCIFLIAMHDRVSQSLAERQLDIELPSGNTLGAFNQSHQAIYSR